MTAAVRTPVPPAGAPAVQEEAARLGLASLRRAPVRGAPALGPQPSGRAQGARPVARSAPLCDACGGRLAHQEDGASEMEVVGAQRRPPPRPPPPQGAALLVGGDSAEVAWGRGRLVWGSVVLGTQLCGKSPQGAQKLDRGRRVRRGPAWCWVLGAGCWVLGSGLGPAHYGAPEASFLLPLSKDKGGPEHLGDSEGLPEFGCPYPVGRRPAKPRNSEPVPRRPVASGRSPLLPCPGPPHLCSSRGHLSRPDKATARPKGEEPSKEAGWVPAAQRVQDLRDNGQGPGLCPLGRQPQPRGCPTRRPAPTSSGSPSRCRLGLV